MRKSPLQPLMDRLYPVAQALGRPFEILFTKERFA
jgi:hypothetical protein